MFQCPGCGRGPDDAEACEAVLGAGLESEFILSIYFDDTIHLVLQILLWRVKENYDISVLLLVNKNTRSLGFCQLPPINYFCS